MCAEHSRHEPLVAVHAYGDELARLDVVFVEVCAELVGENIQLAVCQFAVVGNHRHIIGNFLQLAAEQVEPRLRGVVFVGFALAQGKYLGLVLGRHERNVAEFAGNRHIHSGARNRLGEDFHVLLAVHRAVVFHKYGVVVGHGVHADVEGELRRVEREGYLLNAVDGRAVVQTALINEHHLCVVAVTLNNTGVGIEVEFVALLQLPVHRLNVVSHGLVFPTLLGGNREGAHEHTHAAVKVGVCAAAVAHGEVIEVVLTGEDAHCGGESGLKETAHRNVMRGTEFLNVVSLEVMRQVTG